MSDSEGTVETKKRGRPAANSNADKVFILEEII